MTVAAEFSIDPDLVEQQVLDLKKLGEQMTTAQSQLDQIAGRQDASAWSAGGGPGSFAKELTAQTTAISQNIGSVALFAEQLAANLRLVLDEVDTMDSERRTALLSLVAETEGVIAGAKAGAAAGAAAGAGKEKSDGSVFGGATASGSASTSDSSDSPW
ncbi:hypothetical protein [Homoserinibacter sp. YIM 151385]|uniref:hypothetical protein n=1 Tax=Homoserinibacter sp. YIM 151385 TaxID=2985506 RepID=UPI0022F0C49E|nr:hypothetical protein [Homoserinibacter sp. YIM 151385]WBU38699.1 hypothetical protein OF852_03690 [Homoserinibacter sp. YIM 151385]